MGVNFVPRPFAPDLKAGHSFPLFRYAPHGERDADEHAASKRTSNYVNARHELRKTFVGKE
jgi:hypothetical protein